MLKTYDFLNGTEKTISGPPNESTILELGHINFIQVNKTLYNLISITRTDQKRNIQYLSPSEQLIREFLLHILSVTVSLNNCN